MLACVLTFPDNQIAIGNAVGVAIGWVLDNYSVALSADGGSSAIFLGGLCGLFQYGVR